MELATSAGEVRLITELELELDEQLLSAALRLGGIISLHLLAPEFESRIASAHAASVFIFCENNEFNEASQLAALACLN